MLQNKGTIGGSQTSPILHVSDNTKMYVQTSNNKNRKKHLCCIFCKKLVLKLARHLEGVHKDELEIQKLLKLPKGNLLNFIPS